MVCKFLRDSVGISLCTWKLIHHQFTMHVFGSYRMTQCWYFNLSKTWRKNTSQNHLHWPLSTTGLLTAFLIRLNKKQYVSKLGRNFEPDTACIFSRDFSEITTFEPLWVAVGVWGLPPNLPPTPELIRFDLFCFYLWSVLFFF